jgi:RecB family endonuclease NucS
MEIGMDSKTRKHLENLRSEDRELQNNAFSYILKETEKPVDWAYEVWDQLVAGLRHKDNHIRAISAQILANLAKSDPKNKMQNDFPALMAVTKDEKFVTARHTLQSIWKVGMEKKMQKTVVEALADWFKNCITEKNWTLIRYDIIQDLRNLYDEVKDEQIKQKALELIETEEDPKYKKKYANVWK